MPHSSGVWLCLKLLNPNSCGRKRFRILQLLQRQYLICIGTASSTGNGRNDLAETPPWPQVAEPKYGGFKLRPSLMSSCHSLFLESQVYRWSAATLCVGRKEVVNAQSWLALLIPEDFQHRGGSSVRVVRRPKRIGLASFHQVAFVLTEILRG